MKPIFNTILFLATIAVSAQAQDFKLAKSSGTLELKEVNHVTIVGYSGNEILISTIRGDRNDEVDKRSKGLRAISSNGLEDNTGLGLSVIDKGATIEVRQLKKMDGPDVKISVPKGISISYEHTSPYGSDVHISNVEGKVEVSTVHNGVKLENVTGSVDVKTVHGEAEAIFGPNLTNSIRIESAHGPVDVSFPVTTKANVYAKTEHGEILVDPDFKIEVDRSGGMIRYNDTVTGKMNGGGIEIRLTAIHNNVYLRKK